MNKEKLRHYANVISAHAESHWVTPFFFVLFFIDSWLLFIPVDTLLAATVTLKPAHRRKWVGTAVAGFALGLALLAILVNSHLQPYLFNFFHHRGYTQQVLSIVEHVQDYGYMELTLGVFTFLPSLFGVLIGVALGLNPFIVWFVSMAAKVVKILVTVWLVISGHRVVKKYLKIWLKSAG